jgi:hypothetical protein
MWVFHWWCGFGSAKDEGVTVYESTIPVPWPSINRPYNTEGQTALKLTGTCRCYANLCLHFGCSKIGFTQPLKARVLDLVNFCKFSTHFLAAGRGGLSWILKYIRSAPVKEKNRLPHEISLNDLDHIWWPEGHWILSPTVSPKIISHNLNLNLGSSHCHENR